VTEQRASRAGQDVARTIRRHFEKVLHESTSAHARNGRQIGVELKFPLVCEDGRAPERHVIPALWAHLCASGWEPVRDDVSARVIGARKKTEGGYTNASCETGYCKPEFSLAPVRNLIELEAAVRGLRQELLLYAERRHVHFLGYGIQPVSPPDRRLRMDKSRTRVWDSVFRSNRVVPPERGHDLDLFTLNAASHVHVSASAEEAVPLVNVFNGFAGPQIALTANSTVWRGRVDPDYACVTEKFWDWWVPEEGRVGLPLEPFKDIGDYARQITRLRPVFVKREGEPVLIQDYETFEHYYAQEQAVGTSLEDRRVAVTPRPADIDLHCTCCWHPTRITRYGTVEVRPNDQQPPGALPAIAALTLGLTESLQESHEELGGLRWEDLRAARDSACRLALSGKVGLRPIDGLAARMLELARLGLQGRGLGEERFLGPLEERLRSGRPPAADAAGLFEDGGAEKLVKVRAFV